jgi:4-amino-4-deoxy-L-arabinose transferase-like glycosyltransferase
MRCDSTYFMPMKYTFPVLLVCGLISTSILIFLNLGSGSIDLWDEAITAGRSLNIYNSHSIMNLSVNGDLSLRKPPLMYLINAFSLKLFGINELGLRIPNALFGVGCFGMLAIAVSSVCGIPWAALSVWLLLGAHTLIEVSREAQTDTIYAFGFLCAFSAVLLDLKNGTTTGKRWRWLYALGLFLVLFGKGPIGLFIAAYTMVFLFFVDKRLAVSYVIPTCMACLPLVGWMVLQSLLAPDFLSIFLKEEYLERLNYSSNFLRGHIRSPFWYFSNLWYQFRLIGFLSLLMPVLAFMVLKKKKISYSREWRILLFLFGLVASYMVLISVASHKSDRYLLPMLPLFILLLLYSAKLIVSWSENRTARRAIYFVLLCAVPLGLHATGFYYVSVPNYQPKGKTVSLEVARYSESCTVYTDSKRLAPIMHFYLNRPVYIALARRTPSEESIFVSTKATETGREYSISSSCKGK